MFEGENLSMKGKVSATCRKVFSSYWCSKITHNFFNFARFEKCSDGICDMLLDSKFLLKRDFLTSLTPVYDARK